MSTDRPMKEFDCIDCGEHATLVVERHANDQDICLECLWIRDIKDDAERRKAWKDRINRLTRV